MERGEWGLPSKTENGEMGTDFYDSGLKVQKWVWIVQAMLGKGYKKISYFGLKWGHGFEEPSGTQDKKVPRSTSSGAETLPGDKDLVLSRSLANFFLPSRLL